jgi:hypothetical protein
MCAEECEYYIRTHGCSDYDIYMKTLEDRLEKSYARDSRDFHQENTDSSWLGDSPMWWSLPIRMREHVKGMRWEMNKEVIKYCIDPRK